MRSEPTAIGTLIAGKYRVDRVVADGGMGLVAVATDTVLRRRVALKMLRPDRSGKRHALARFLREARAAGAVDSQHVARIFEVGETENGAPYLVMEYLKGRTLADAIAVQGQVSVEQAVEYVLQAAEGLAAAHALGIIHRDVKPANLFLARQADGRSTVKVLDFGISKTVLTLSPSLTAKGQLVGSPSYMSPEQMRCASEVDARTDIWSLGVVLYELLTGQLPHTGDSLPELIASVFEDEPASVRESREDVAEELDQVVRRCLAKEPAQRYLDLGELASVLAVHGSEQAQRSAERICRTLAHAGAGGSSSPEGARALEAARPIGEQDTQSGDDDDISVSREPGLDGDELQSTLESARHSRLTRRVVSRSRARTARVVVLGLIAIAVAAIVALLTRADRRRSLPAPLPSLGVQPPVWTTGEGTQRAAGRDSPAAPAAEASRTRSIQSAAPADVRSQTERTKRRGARGAPAGDAKRTRHTAGHRDIIDPWQ